MGLTEIREKHAQKISAAHTQKRTISIKMLRHKRFSKLNKNSVFQAHEQWQYTGCSFTRLAQVKREFTMSKRPNVQMSTDSQVCFHFLQNFNVVSSLFYTESMSQLENQ